jgi:hypothetical protein
MSSQRLPPHEITNVVESIRLDPNFDISGLNPLDRAVVEQRVQQNNRINSRFGVVDRNTPQNLQREQLESQLPRPDYIARVGGSRRRRRKSIRKTKSRR